MFFTKPKTYDARCQVEDMCESHDSERIVRENRTMRGSIILLKTSGHFFGHQINHSSNH